ncbi:hypothetical protein PG993_012671 [Apiospora rasikravindrae]|uniref:Uncharacterized protein n=1 Tax=Apiospora rasikravindrae TaxID=990691 RepID=A0ABR1S4I6_9PEZI
MIANNSATPWTRVAHSTGFVPEGDPFAFRGDLAQAMADEWAGATFHLCLSLFIWDKLQLPPDHPGHLARRILDAAERQLLQLRLLGRPGAPLPSLDTHIHAVQDDARAENATAMAAEAAVQVPSKGRSSMVQLTSFADVEASFPGFFKRGKWIRHDEQLGSSLGSGVDADRPPSPLFLLSPDSNHWVVEHLGAVFSVMEAQYDAHAGSMAGTEIGRRVDTARELMSRHEDGDFRVERVTGRIASLPSPSSP